MKPMVWVGITKDISYKKHTFKSGDSGNPVYCDMVGEYCYYVTRCYICIRNINCLLMRQLCKDADRHLHVDYCPDEKTCKASELAKRKDQIEHIKGSYTAALVS